MVNFPETGGIDKKLSKKRELGVLAQDVQKAFPDLVEPYIHENGKEYLSVNYTGLIAPLIQATSEQQKEIEKNLRMFKMMQSQVVENSRKIAAIEAELELVKAANADIKAKNTELETRSTKIEIENDELKSSIESMNKFLCRQFPDAEICKK